MAFPSNSFKKLPLDLRTEKMRRIAKSNTRIDKYVRTHEKIRKSTFFKVNLFQHHTHISSVFEL